VIWENKGKGFRKKGITAVVVIIMSVTNINNSMLDLVRLALGCLIESQL